MNIIISVDKLTKKRFKANAAESFGKKDVVLRNSCKKTHNFCMFAKTDKQTRKNEILYQIGQIFFLLHPDSLRGHGGAGPDRTGRS